MNDRVYTNSAQSEWKLEDRWNQNGAEDIKSRYKWQNYRCKLCLQLNEPFPRLKCIGITNLTHNRRTTRSTSSSPDQIFLRDFATCVQFLILKARIDQSYVLTFMSRATANVESSNRLFETAFDINYQNRKCQKASTKSFYKKPSASFSQVLQKQKVMSQDDAKTDELPAIQQGRQDGHEAAAVLAVSQQLETGQQPAI